MWLLPQGDNALYQQTLSNLTTDGLYQWKGLTPPTPYFKTIEEATGVTLEEFYQSFKEPSELCLEAPYFIWSSH